MPPLADISFTRYAAGAAEEVTVVARYQDDAISAAASTEVRRVGWRVI